MFSDRLLAAFVVGAITLGMMDGGEAKSVLGRVPARLSGI